MSCGGRGGGGAAGSWCGWMVTRGGAGCALGSAAAHPSLHLPSQHTHTSCTSCPYLTKHTTPQPQSHPPTLPPPSHLHELGRHVAPRGPIEVLAARLPPAGVHHGQRQVVDGVQVARLARRKPGELRRAGMGVEGSDVCGFVFIVGGGVVCEDVWWWWWLRGNVGVCGGDGGWVGGEGAGRGQGHADARCAGGGHHSAAMRPCSRRQRSHGRAAPRGAAAPAEHRLIRRRRGRAHVAPLWRPRDGQCLLAVVHVALADLRLPFFGSLLVDGVVRLAGGHAAELQGGAGTASGRCAAASRGRREPHAAQQAGG
jgi:hypothetical protein